MDTTQTEAICAIAAVAAMSARWSLRFAGGTCDPSADERLSERSQPADASRAVIVVVRQVPLALDAASIADRVSSQPVGATGTLQCGDATRMARHWAET
mgnify:CR=1 FL=1